MQTFLYRESLSVVATRQDWVFGSQAGVDYQGRVLGALLGVIDTLIFLIVVMA